MFFYSVSYLYYVIISFKLMTICIYVLFCIGFSNAEFDLELVKSVLPLFTGTRDFRSFMGKTKQNIEYYYTNYFKTLYKTRLNVYNLNY